MSPRVLVKVMEMLLSLFRALFVGRANLALENLALRQQVAALKRERPRPPLDDSDRAFWVALKDQWSRWSDHLILVTPGTVVRWHRASFGKHWGRISRRRVGRPRTSAEIRTMTREWPRRPARYAPSSIFSGPAKCIPESSRTDSSKAWTGAS